jgi:hypothetical protein
MAVLKMDRPNTASTVVQSNRFQFHFSPLHAGPVNQIELWIADAGRAPAAR